jgi:hypothetical protein
MRPTSAPTIITAPPIVGVQPKSGCEQRLVEVKVRDETSRCALTSAIAAASANASGVTNPPL